MFIWCSLFNSEKLNNKFDIELPVSGVLENSICSQWLHIVYTKSFSLASAVFLRSKFHITSIYPLKSMFSSTRAIHIFSLADAWWQGAAPHYRLFSSFLGLHSHLMPTATPPLLGERINKCLQKLPEGPWEKEPSSYGKTWRDVLGLMKNKLQIDSGYQLNLVSFHLFWQIGWIVYLSKHYLSL